MTETEAKKGVSGAVAGIVVAIVTIGILIAGYMIWLKPPPPVLKGNEIPPPPGAHSNIKIPEAPQ